MQGPRAAAAAIWVCGYASMRMPMRYVGRASFGARPELAANAPPPPLRTPPPVPLVAAFDPAATKGTLAVFFTCSRVLRLTRLTAPDGYFFPRAGGGSGGGGGGGA
eukprot:6016844-Pyramimonas_sp.AAC.1